MKFSFNKLKSAIKNGAAVTSNLSSHLIGSSNDKNNFPHKNNFSHKLLLTDTQVSKVCKAYANGSPAYVTFSKT